MSMPSLDEFDIVIRRKSANTIAALPQLGLYAKGADLNSALEVLEQKKKLLLEDLASGAVDPDLIRSLGKTPPPASHPENLGPFALKAGILITLITFAVMVAAEFAAAKLETVMDKGRVVVASSVQEFTGGSGRKFWTGVEQALERAADPASDIPEEKKEKILSNIRTVAARWRPFVSEAISVVASPDAAKPSQ